MTDLQVVQELHSIRARHDGLLKPEDVIESARADTSPLHDHFTWDDGEAAHRFRLAQARQLISYIVEDRKVGDQVMSVRVFCSLTTDRVRDGGGYRSIIEVLEDPEQRRQMLADVFAEFKRIELKYAHMEELADIFKEVHKAIQRKGPKSERPPKKQLAGVKG